MILDDDYDSIDIIHNTNIQQYRMEYEVHRFLRDSINRH